MNRKNKILIVFLSVIFCFSAFTLSAYAVGESDGEYSDVVPGDNQGGGESGGSDVVVPPESSGGDSESGGNGDNSDIIDNSGSSGDNGDNNNGGDNNGGDIGDNNSSSYVDNSGNDYYNNYNSGYDNNNGYDYNNGYDEQGGYEQGNDGESSYLGGGQTYIPPQNTAPSASLYNSSGSVGDKTLNSNDWNDISERLKNASNNSDDGDDFSFIQKNNSLTDNGGWMPIVGVVCFALSATGIVYFIFLTVQNKKKSRFVSSPNAGRMPKQSSSSDYYGDGYRTNSAKSSKKKSKFDTAEVSLPKNVQGKRYKNGGKRYR